MGRLKAHDSHSSPQGGRACGTVPCSSERCNNLYTHREARYHGRAPSSQSEDMGVKRLRSVRSWGAHFSRGAATLRHDRLPPTRRPRSPRRYPTSSTSASRSPVDSSPQQTEPRFNAMSTRSTTPISIWPRMRPSWSAARQGLSSGPPCAGRRRSPRPTFKTPAALQLRQSASRPPWDATEPRPSTADCSSAWPGEPALHQPVVEPAFRAVLSGTRNDLGD
jgi:hypothetical protein